MKYLCKQGLPITMEEWRDLFENANYRHLAFDEIHQANDVATISTVWMGIDTIYGSNDPLIFETMVIYKHEKEEHIIKTPTLEKAMETHRVMVEHEKLKNKGDIISERYDEAIRWHDLADEMNNG